MHLLGYHLPRHGFLIRIRFHRGCAESSLKRYQLGLFLTFAELELDRRMDILSYRSNEPESIMATDNKGGNEDAD